MKYIPEILAIALCLLFLAACSTEVKPTIVPAIEVPQNKPTHSHVLGTIGAVEPIYILPMKAPFSARIDTGAENSSLDVQSLKHFERDGKKWVSFTVVNRDNGEKHVFEKPVKKTTVITRIGKNEKRPIVEMEVRLGKQLITAKFSLADREKFEYQALIGRNILAGRAIVDPNISNTLY